MARKVLGIVLGIVAAFAVVISMELVGHKIWPPPKNVNFKDAAQVAAMMNAMPAMIGRIDNERTMAVRQGELLFIIMCS